VNSSDINLTFKKGCGKVDADVSIPTSSTFSFDLARQPMGFQLFEPQKHSVSVAESDNDPGDSQKKGLRPEFEKFTLIFELLLVVEQLRSCF
jgi:hypothetical protein